MSRLLGVTAAGIAAVTFLAVGLVSCSSAGLDAQRARPLAVSESLTPRPLDAWQAAETAAEIDLWDRTVAWNDAVARAAMNGDGPTGTIWDSVERCEEGGNGWHVHSSTYSGGLGISNAAWHENGGDVYGPDAGYATPAQQVVVAERIYGRFGASAWGSDACSGLR